MEGDDLEDRAYGRITLRWKCEVCCHGDEYVCGDLRGCDSVWTCRRVPSFRRILLPPFSSLCMEASSEKLVPTDVPTRSHNPEDRHGYFTEMMKWIELTQNYAHWQILLLAALNCRVLATRGYPWL
jgi:hypothetical protein